MLSLAAFALIGGAALFSNKSAITAKADTAQTYGRSATSGTVIYVDGRSTYFNTNQADLAVYCFNSSSDFAWTDKINYRCYADMLRVVLPYQNGVSKTWAKMIVCRYNPAMDPKTNGFDGVYNQTNDIGFSEFLYAQNTVIITGYGEGNKINYTLYSNLYYGVKSEKHMYLDLSGFTSWEEGDAKFAIYFACPSSGDATGWSQQYINGSYQPSFLWKVEGQDNDHLYECIVPVHGYSVWNLVIAVRFSPDTAAPNFDSYWNKSQNLSFNSENHQANMIHVNDWNEAQLDKDNVISDDSRLDFFGRYFLDTVSCSGTGSSDATTSEMWGNAKVAYNHLSRLLQGNVWQTVADESGSLVAQAMARYDYILFYKGYDHEDFINRKESENKTDYSSILVSGVTTDNSLIGVIIAISSVTLLGTLSLLVIKKRHK